MPEIQAASLGQAVHCFLEASVVPEKMPQALDALARSMGARGALLSTPRYSLRGTPISHGLDESFSAFMEGGWDKADERTSRGVRWYCDHGKSFMCEDMLFSRAAIARSDYFNNFAIKNDVPWFAAAPLMVGDGLKDFVALSFNRRAKEGAFTRSDINRLNSVLPTLEIAATMCRESMLAQERGVLVGLDLIAKPAFLLNWQGRVIAQNASAGAYLGSTLTLSLGRLRSHVHFLQSKIDRAIDAAVTASDPDRPAAQMVDLGASPETGRAKLQIMPLFGSAHDVFRNARAIVIVMTAPMPAASHAKAALAQYGLTPREVEIASLLVHGQSSADIADQLKLTRGTSQFYVKSILAKLGVHRQSELVAKLMVEMFNVTQPGNGSRRS